MARIGLLLGAVNALFVHSARLVPLIVTLGAGAVVRSFLLGVVGTSVVNVGRIPPEAIAFGHLALIGWQADGYQIQLSVAVLVWAAASITAEACCRTAADSFDPKPA